MAVTKNSMKHGGDVHQRSYIEEAYKVCVGEQTKHKKKSDDETTKEYETKIKKKKIAQWKVEVTLRMTKK